MAPAPSTTTFTSGAPEHAPLLYAKSDIPNRVEAVEWIAAEYDEARLVAIGEPADFAMREDRARRVEKPELEQRRVRPDPEPAQSVDLGATCRAVHIRADRKF